MGQKYTMLNKISNTGTVRLMFAFTIGIILPLILLKVDSDKYYNILVSISLGLASFCIVAIIPYLKNLNSIIMYAEGIPNLLSELHESTVGEKYIRSYLAAYRLSDMGKIAIENKKYKFAKLINTQILYSVETALSREGGISPSF